MGMQDTGIRSVVTINDPAGQHAIDQHERLAPGAVLTVAERAQAVLRHDVGARLLLDGGAALTVSERGAALRAGRLWADASAQIELQLGELTLVCTPARHFSGRFLTRNTTLWASWALIGPQHRAFFGGDTGYTKSFGDIGADYGPFDLTLMPIGAYHAGWPDIHMNPEFAVRAHRDVTDSGLLVPIHWATFRLAPHPWSEPVERMIVAARDESVDVAVPMPGQRLEPARLPGLDEWWRPSSQ